MTGISLRNQNKATQKMASQDDNAKDRGTRYCGARKNNLVTAEKFDLNKKTIANLPHDHLTSEKMLGLR